jgi:hypothetical protein
VGDRVHPAGHDDCVRVLDVELCRRIRGEGADERAHPETSEGIDEATDVEQLIAESPDSKISSMASRSASPQGDRVRAKASPRNG